MTTATLLGLLIIPFVLFIPLSWRKPIASSEFAIDEHIPFVPAFVIPYLSWFVLVPFTIYSVIDTPWARECVIAMSFAMWAALVVWYALPTSIVRPHVPKNGALNRIMRIMYTIDGPANTFPSSHVFLSLISGYYLSLVYPQWTALFWAWALVTASSTVFVKQHHFVDVIGGIFFALIAVMASIWLVG